MKTLKGTFVFLLLILMIACIPIHIFADGNDPVVPLEMNEETLQTITEELMDTLHLKIQHLDLYGTPEEILELGQSAKALFEENDPEIIIIPVETSELLSYLMSEGLDDSIIISREELLDLMGAHVGNNIISMQSTQMGISYTALISTSTVSRCYVADLEQEMVVILKYGNDFSVAADFFTSGDHVVTVSESLVPTEMIPQIEAMLTGKIN